MKRLALLISLVCVVCTSFVLADVIYLKDGTKLEGDVKRNDDGWIVYSKGGTTRVRPEQVQSIELKSSGATAPMVAAEHLASLRRSVENMTDLKEIVSRFQHFIETANDPASVDEAKKDMAMWQDRSDQNMIKVGSKWVPASERTKLVERAVALAEQARQLMKQGRTKEAEPVLVEATTDDPQNASGIYLLALLRYQQEQLPAARKGFDGVAAIVPNHAPTLNNLAVVQWRQRQFVAALASYDGAMQAAPVNKDILDNVASALQSLPPEFRNSPVTQKVTRHFQEQDKSLQEQMAQAGWHRFGAGWVTDKEIDQIQQQTKENQDKLDALAAEFDKIREHLSQIDRNIQDTESSMHRIEATTFSRDPNTGQFLQLPYPPTYYDLQNDDQRFHQDRVKEAAKLDTLKQSAQALKQRMPVPKTIDVQKIIGAEGTPIVQVVDAPTTHPSTQP